MIKEMFRRGWSEDYSLREAEVCTWFEEQGIRLEKLD